MATWQPRNRMETSQRQSEPPQSQASAGQASRPEAERAASFDAWMWSYLQAAVRRQSLASPAAAPFDEDAIEEELDLAWGFLEDRKYFQAQQQCRTALGTIEQHLARDFARDLTAFTLFDYEHSELRDSYLAILDVYQRVLVSQVVALLLSTDDINDLDVQYERYQTLRRQIVQDISHAAYLLGNDYGTDIFLTRADMPHLDDLVRQHCQFLLKRDFFRTFKIVIQALGPLDRDDFHRVTEPYKTLRDLCDRCLAVLARMKDQRFFGPVDVFIEKYEHDVQVYQQILWYLGLKSDLNKVDKFLHPNTYSGGQDTQTHVFEAVELLQDVLPHLQQARAAGLGPQATTTILELYAEHWCVILNYEAAQCADETANRDGNESRLRLMADLRAIFERYTEQQTTTRKRIQFSHKFLKKTRLAFRLQDHDIIEVPNPDGRALKRAAQIPDFLNALDTPLLTEMIHDLRLQYRSRFGLKMQRLRWSWFAERALPEGFFEPLHFEYLDYIQHRWKANISDHYDLLQRLAARGDD